MLTRPETSNIQYSRSFTANSGTNAAVLPKGRSSTPNSGIKVAVLLGMNVCGSFPLFSAPHISLASEQTLKDLKWSQGLPRGGEESGFGCWALRTSQKFTTGIKYQFHHGFWPDHKSGNTNHPSPTIYSSDWNFYRLFLKALTVI